MKVYEIYLVLVDLNQLRILIGPTSVKLLQILNIRIGSYDNIL